jgi:hypothetical protein
MEGGNVVAGFSPRFHNVDSGGAAG